MKKITAFLLAGSLSLLTLDARFQLDTQVWDNPSFQKEFLGSYGFLAGSEPEINDEEKDALRALIDLIKASPSAAIQQLEPQITPDSSAAFDFILGNLYLQDGNLQKAEQYYKNAVVKFPDFRRAYKNLGLVQAQAGNLEGVVETLTKAVQLGQIDGQSYGLLGLGYLQQQKYYPAEAAYRQAIIMQPEVMDWKVGLAHCLQESGRYEDAIAMLDTLLKEQPDNADFWTAQGNAYLGQEQYLKAAQNFEVVRRMGSADLNKLKLLGDIYINNDAPDLALNAYLEANQVATSSDSNVLIQTANIFYSRGNLEEATQMIDAVRSRFSSDLPVESELKLLTIEAKLARSNGREAEAAEILEQIIERDELNGEAIIELANYYAEQGDLAKAITRFEFAANIEEFEYPALVAHAQALVQARKYEDATSLLDRALQIKSTDSLADYAKRVKRAAESQS